MLFLNFNISYISLHIFFSFSKQSSEIYHQISELAETFQFDQCKADLGNEPAHLWLFSC